MNASAKLGPLELILPIYGWLMPLVFIVTLISNSLIIMVLSRWEEGPVLLTILSRASMQSPTNTVLLGMAACDLATIILPAPWYFYLYTLGHHDSVAWTVLGCHMFEFMQETAPQIFHTASNWLTLGRNIYRRYSIPRPTGSR